MSAQQKIATIFGGTGFVGRQVVQKLATHGFLVKVLTRAPESAYALKTSGSVGQIVPLAINYNDEHSLVNAIKNSYVVVNCIGILDEKNKKDFEKIHTDLPKAIALACQKEKVSRFIHLSALGIEKSHSKYAQSKHAGEKEIFKAFKTATILRPGIIFGKDDNFFNKFAELGRYLPALPLIGGGKTRFQPVYIGDVAEAVMAAINKPSSVVQGKIFELGGPDIVTFREVYEKLFTHTQRRRSFIRIPFIGAKIIALFLELLPKPPLTRDQVESLKTDNVTANNALTLSDLGIHAHAMDTILPAYLERFCSGGHFDTKRTV